MSTADLHSRLGRDTQLLRLADATLLLFLGLLLLVVPAGIIRLLDLGGATEMQLRVLGLIWLVAGLALGVSGRRPLSASVLAVLALFHTGFAASLVLGPFVLRLTLGPLAWFLIGGLCLLMGALGAAWWLTRVRLVTTGSRSLASAAPAPRSTSASAGR